MIELNINDMKDTERHSSKGNQLKWNPANTETWYKADYIGYEGLTEYMVSHLLMHSTLSTKDFVLYDTEILRVGKKDYLGCKSSNFLPDGWQLLTLERLFHTLHGKSLYQSIFQFGEVEDRAQFLVDQVIQMTGLKDFGKYLCTLLTIDALFLNEDRHIHLIQHLAYGRRICRAVYKNHVRRIHVVIFLQFLICNDTRKIFWKCLIQVVINACMVISVDCRE